MVISTFSMAYLVPMAMVNGSSSDVDGFDGDILDFSGIHGCSSSF
jgi:hypothetical protein